MSPRKIVVGVGGASGSPYARRLLDFFKAHGEEAGIEPHVVFSKTGRLVWSEEVGTDPHDYGFPLYNPSDLTAPFASGSARFESMVVVPCSTAGLARIATGTSNDLIGRAADVILKEQRRLILVVRETPFSLIHLRNMVAVTEAGAMVMPACPSFYSGPETLTALIDTVTARILDRLGVDNALMTRWSGLQHRPVPLPENAP